MNQTLQNEVSLFFRQFALQHLPHGGKVAPTPLDIKTMMVNHCEEIYPAFSETSVFKQHYQHAEHENMVDEYKRCFTLLLSGRLP